MKTYEVTYQVTNAEPGRDSARIIHTDKAVVAAANMADARGVAVEQIQAGPFFDRRIKTLGVRTLGVKEIET